jgi:23S rRNA pseudouridine955/2504/2580 synthase
VIDKPAGVAVHGGSGVSFGVIEQLRKAHPDWKFLELVHRLDRETSGLLMLAKKRSALVKLHDMMRANVPDKRYLAWASASGTRARKPSSCPVQIPHRRRRASRQGGRRRRWPVCPYQFQHCGTLCRLHPGGSPFATGRTHQIRVHMQASGCPIAGDEKYGDFALNKELARSGLKRMFLHARSLTLPHPLTGEPLKLEAPLPASWKAFAETEALMARVYDLLVFDWDGTLMDSTAHITHSIQNACRELGLPVPDRQAASHVIGLRLDQALHMACPGLDDTAQSAHRELHPPLPQQ